MNLKLEYIVVSITGYCNMSCKGCFRVDQGSEMRIDKFLSLDPMLKKLGARYVNFTGGEPLCNQNLPEFLRISKEWGYKNILSTNGMLIDDSNIDLLDYVDILALSLDGGIKDINDKYRIEGHFDSTLRLIDRVYHNYPKVELKINTLVTSHNITHINSIGDLLSQYADRIKCWKLFQVSSRGSENTINETDKVYDEDFLALYTDVKNQFGKILHITSLMEKKPVNYCIIRSDGSLNIVSDGQYNKIEDIEYLPFSFNSYEETSLGI